MLRKKSEIIQLFKQNRAFLKKHQSLWTKEVLNYYPDSLNGFPKQWRELLSKLEHEELYLIDGRLKHDHLHDSEFKNFLIECRRLELFPSLPEIKKDYPTWAWYGVKGKKKHEIIQMASLIKQKCNECDVDEMIDIGGGVGHLARIVSHYEEVPVTSIDINPALQEKGVLRRDKYPKPVGHGQLTFKQAEYGKEFIQANKTNKSLFHNKTGMMGLHTCGELANHFIDNLIESPASFGMNLGCCYLKMEPETQTNLSQLAKDYPLPYTKYGLTLATRGHMQLSPEEFKYKIQVKKYRYLLHLFFVQELGIKEFIGVGDSHQREYDRPFHEYVRRKCHEVGINDKLRVFTDEQIQSFFDNEENQEIFKELFYCDVIRWQVGRLLEIDLLLDRAIYAMDNGLEVEMFQLFNVDISPRNIAIVYKRIKK